MGHKTGYILESFFVFLNFMILTLISMGMYFLGFPLAAILIMSFNISMLLWQLQVDTISMRRNITRYLNSLNKNKEDE